MTENHRIRVSKGEVTIEVEGPESFVEEKYHELKSEYLKNAEYSASTKVEESETEPTSNEVIVTLDEVYNHTDIGYKRDAALLIGWYIEKVLGEDEFTKSEIEDWAIKAKIELGKNLVRDLGSLRQRGHLREVGQRNNETTYYLTRAGEAYVEEELGIPSEFKKY